MASVPRGNRRLHLMAEKSFGLTNIPSSPSRRVRSDTPVKTRNPVPPQTVNPPVVSRTVPATPIPAIAIPPAPASPPKRVPSYEPPLTPTLPGLAPIEDGPFTSPVLDTNKKTIELAQLDESQVKPCRKCRLCETRTNTVFGEGDVDARLMFIGEGPGENEDLSGRPFVGRAGDLLEKQINAMGLRRDQVFIANVVKCRPPGNRAPAPDETLACTPFLVRQIEIVRPTVIVTLGLPATQFVLSTKVAMGKLRGQWHVWRGIAVMPTYHPAYLLRNYTDEVRRMVWSDLQLVMKRLKSDAPAKEN